MRRIFLAVLGLMFTLSAYAHRGIFDRVVEILLTGRKVVVEVVEYVYPYETRYDRIKKLMDSDLNGIISQEEADKFASSRALSLISRMRLSVGDVSVVLTHVSSRADKYPPHVLKNYPIVLWHRFEGFFREKACEKFTFSDTGFLRASAVRVRWRNFCAVKTEAGWLKRGVVTEVFQKGKNSITLNFVEE